MSDIKEETISLIKNLPDDITLDDIIEAISLRKKILEGIKDLNEGRFITDTEMQLKINQRLQEIQEI